MSPVALIFPSTMKSSRLPSAYAKKDKNTDFAYAGGKNAKICVVRWNAYARRQDTELTYVLKKLAYAKIRIRPLLFYSCCLGSLKMSSLSYVEQISGTTFCTRYVYDNRLKLFKY